MSIAWCRPNDKNANCIGGYGVGNELPHDTVYAAGFDKKYLVAAVHPTVWGKEIDKSKTSYYYVSRAADEKTKFPDGRIRGPLTQVQFEAAKVALHLPAFSRVFDELK